LDIRQTCAAARGKGKWESGYGRQTSAPALRRPVPVLQQGVAAQLAAHRDLGQPERGAGAVRGRAAAHALSHGATLVSNNLREYGRVRDLVSENWV